MLSLVRYPGESVIIGNDITVIVLSVKRHRVRLGFEAPKDVSVHRREVYERIKQGLPPQRKPSQ